MINSFLFNFKGFEETYNELLTTYTLKETNKKEKDFLLNCISELNEIIEDKKSYNVVLSGKSNEDIRAEILKEKLPNYKNIEDWIKAEIKKRKIHKSILKEERLLTSLKLKLDRLPKEKTSSININENPHPEIFRNNADFLIFKKYIDKHFVKPYKDISYIYRKIYERGGLIKTTHLKFADFLFENGYIDFKLLEQISSRKGFETKDNEERLNNYLNIEKEVENI